MPSARGSRRIAKEDGSWQKPSSTTSRHPTRHGRSRTDGSTPFPSGERNECLTLQPGWRWSQHVKPIAGTELCEAPHFQYQVSGVLHISMADGTDLESRAGDVTALPQGHDAWVEGTEPVALIDRRGRPTTPRVDESTVRSSQRAVRGGRTSQGAVQAAS